MDANKRWNEGCGVSGAETNDFITNSKSSSQSDSICLHWLLKLQFLKCDSIRCLFITDTKHVCPCPRGRECLPSKGNVPFALEGNTVYFPRLLALQVCLESLSSVKVVSTSVHMMWRNARLMEDCLQQTLVLSSMTFTLVILVL